LLLNLKLNGLESYVKRHPKAPDTMATSSWKSLQLAIPAFL